MDEEVNDTLAIYEVTRELAKKIVEAVDDQSNDYDAIEAVQYILNQTKDK